MAMPSLRPLGQLNNELRQSLEAHRKMLVGSVRPGTWMMFDGQDCLPSFIDTLRKSITLLEKLVNDGDVIYRRRLAEGWTE